MSLGVNTNSSSNNGVRLLGQTQKKVSSALQKLSSGYAINQASDDPAALVMSELLRAQISGMQQSVQNTQTASNVLSIAEGGMQEVSSMLSSMRGLALAALNSGVSGSGQTAANQASINGMLSSISHIASTTSFAGQNLLNGAQEINFSAAGNLVDATATTIDSMSDISGQTFSVQFSGNAADQAEKAYLETSFGTTGVDTLQNFTVTGNVGSANFTFAAGTSMQEMADTINSGTDQTGVTAYVFNDGTADQLRLTSEDYGSDQFVQVTQNAGDAFGAAGATVRDAGRNAVVTIDGQQVEADGLDVAANTANFSGTLRLTGAAAQAGYENDTLTDASAAAQSAIGDLTGGMRLQLSDGTGVQNRDIISIGSADTSKLGQVTIDGQSYSLSDLYSGGTASLAENPEAALAVIDQAISDVAGQRASIGAYQSDTLQSNINSLNVTIENLIATESAIRDADMAKTVTELVQAQIQEQVGTAVLQMSNANAENVLKLLGG